MKLKASAKINISLHILNKRKDGYHNINSILQTVNLYDEIYIEKINKNNIEFSCDWTEFKKFSCDDNKNIAYLTALKLKKFFKINSGVKIHIIKHIPPGGGLGGGSSDAAEVILGFLKLFKIKISRNELIKFSKKIGSDIPFFLYKGCCYIEGKGEKIRKLHFPWRKNSYILLIYPDINISTEKIYSLWDKNKPRSLTNDFENIVFELYPEIYKLKKILVNFKSNYVSLTGTGSCIYGLFYNREKSIKIFKKLTELYKNYKVYLLKLVSK